MTWFFFYCNTILAHLIGTITEWEFNEVLVSVKIKGKHWAHRNTSVYVSSDWYSIIQLGCSDHETVKFKILRLVRRVHGKFATLLIRRADLGLLGDLLRRVLWDKALEGRGVQEKLVDTQGLPLPQPRAMDPKREVRQKCQAAYVDEQAAPGQNQTKKGKPTEDGSKDR